MVIVTRTNLKLSKGKLAAQVAHAAVSLALYAKGHHFGNVGKWFSKWYDEGQKKVVVKVDTEKEFHKLKAKADDMGVPSVIIQDAGHTEIPAGTVTVLGLGPAPEEILDGITGELGLL